jgi:shikimate kinase
MKLTDLFESVNDKGIFKAVFTAGIPGAGKSYTAEKITAGQVQPRVINTDKSFKLPQFAAKWDIGWGDIEYRVKVTNRNQLVRYIDGLLPLLIDGTSSSVAVTIRRSGILQSFGYDVAMIWIDTPLEVALERARKRNRPVAEKYIREIYQTLSDPRFKDFHRSHFHPFVEIDNSEGALTDTVLQQAGNTMSRFFETPVQNPIGQRYIEQMRENNWKYLHDGMVSIEDITSMTAGWYGGI